MLIKVAEGVFERQGYVATTTRDLAREAGVAESVLYHHFPTKAALFRESVLEPLLNVLKAFSAASERYVESPLDDRSMLGLVLSELFDQLSLHRSALRSFTAAEDDLDPAARAAFHEQMSRVLSRIGAISRAEGDRRGFGDPAPRVDLTTRLIAGMFVSVVVHDAWVLPAGDGRPSRAELIEHVTDLVLRGSWPGGEGAEPAAPAAGSAHAVDHVHVAHGSTTPVAGAWRAAWSAGTTRLTNS